MGVCISIFAKKSKTRFPADRAWVLSEWDSKDNALYDLGDMFRNTEEGLSMESTLYYLKECLRINEQNPDRESDRKEYCVYWINEIIKFVKSFPDDIFFVLNDHSDEYYDYCKQYNTIYTVETK